MGESLWKGKVNFFIVAQCFIYWQVNFQEKPSGKTSSRVHTTRAIVGSLQLARWRQASCCRGQTETWVETLSQRLKPGKEICRHTLVGRQILFFTKGVFEEKLPSLGTEAPPNIFWSRYLSHVWVKSRLSESNLSKKDLKKCVFTTYTVSRQKCVFDPLPH